MFGDEVGCRQVEDETAIHLLVEAEIEVIQRHLRIAKLGVLLSSLEQSVAAADQLVGDQARDQIDGSHTFGLSLMETCFQHGSHAAEPQLF